MIQLTRTWFFGLLLLLWAMAPQALEQYGMRIAAEKVPGGYQIVAYNPGVAMMSARVAIADAVNLKVEPALPLFAVVPAGSAAHVLARIEPENPAARFAFKLRSRWVPGSYLAEDEPAVAYRLPFETGRRFVIGQAPGGPIVTHTTPESLYAVDIPMPEGTPIVAARDGVVIDIIADQTEGGLPKSATEPYKKANAVRVAHADGTLASYSHLKAGGVLVAPGERVKAGDRIGLSGSTGYSSGPHLHFVVFRPERREEEFALVSLPFRFYVGDPPLAFAPRYGLVVEAEYSQPAKPPQLSPLLSGSGRSAK